MSLMLFPTEEWVMFTWSRSLPFMIPSTLIREQQTHRHLAKSQPLYQSSSDEPWTIITVFQQIKELRFSSWVQAAYGRITISAWFHHLKSIYRDGQSNIFKSALISSDGFNRPLSKTLGSFTVCCWFSDTARFLTLPWRSLGLHLTWVQQTTG